MPAPVSVLCLAFNRSIADELALRISSPSSPREWSSYQRPIIRHFSALPDAPNLQVEAKAGSGKTTTLLGGIAAIPNARASASTFNSLGHRALGRYLGKRLTLDKSKIRRILREHPEMVPPDAIPSVLRVIDLCRTLGVVPPDFSRPLRNLCPEPDWPDLLAECPDSISPDIILSVLRLSLTAGLAGTIDFSDQIYMPIVLGAAFDRHAVVVCDEAQDISPIQHEFISASLARSGRVITVGDSNQAIYAFRGADASSMSNLRARFPGEVLPLSVSYRCPRSVVAHAQQWVPDILPAENALEGSVEFLGTDWSLTDLPFGSFVLCRNNAPLLRLAVQCLASSVPFSLSSRDIGGQLTDLLNRLVGRASALSVPAFLAKLEAHVTTEVRKRPNSAGYWSDISSSFSVLSGGLSDTSAIALRLRTLFEQPPTGRLTLSTVHKAKGLESSDVFILDAHLFGRFAKSPDELQQESNLQYVAVTRAQSHLFYIDSLVEEGRLP